MTGPLDLTAALNDEIAMRILIVHRELYHDLGELPMIQVRQIAEVIARGLYWGIWHSILQTHKPWSPFSLRVFLVCRHSMYTRDQCTVGIGRVQLALDLSNARLLEAAALQLSANPTVQDYEH